MRSILQQKCRIGHLTVIHTSKGREDVEKLKKVCAVLEALVQEGEARQDQQGADTDPSSEESIRSMAVSEITEAPIQEQQVAAREAQAAATSKGSARARRERKKYAEGKGLRMARSACTRG